MIITKNKVAALTYTLTLNDYDGQIIETVGKEQAVDFLFGTGKLLAAFELALDGKQGGDNFRFQIPASEAYGTFNPEAVIELSKDIFIRDGEMNNEILIIGNEIPMMDKHGKRMTGVVKEVKDTTVTLDFNHPMAGNDLYFKGLIAQVREATYEELNPPQGGCGCGSGGGGCDSPESSGDSCCSTSDSHEGHGHGDSHGGCGCGA